MISRKYTRTAVGIAVVIAELVGPPDPEHLFLSDIPAEPILVRHEPPTVNQASNPMFYFVAPGRLG